MSMSSGCGDAPYEDVLETISESLETISESQKTIAEDFDELLTGQCKHIDQCIDEIISQINDKLGGATKTCDECKNLVAQGMSGTLEYAIQCADSCSKDSTPKGCSPGDGQSEGSSCSGCGQEPCCCHDFVCEPCGEDKPKPKFVGWCNRTTGSIQVLPEGQSPADGNSVPGSPADNEELAFQQAQSLCHQTVFETVTLDTAVPPDVGAIGTLCDLSIFANGAINTINIFNQPSLNALEAATIITDKIRTLGFQGLNVGLIADVVRGATTIWSKQPASLASEWIPKVAGMISCGSDAFMVGARGLSVLGMADKLAGVNLQDFATPYLYAMHSACRQKQLSPNDALDAFLSGAIDFPTLDIHYAIAGFCEQTVKYDVQASKSKPSASQLAEMLRRKVINRDTYAKNMRVLGYIDDGVADTLFGITEPLPDVNSTINILRQGGISDAEAAKYGLDAGLEQFAIPQVKAWIDSTGMSDETVKALWRAHWVTPGIGTLTEFYRRLHTDKTIDRNGELFKSIQESYDANGIPQYWREHYNAMLLQPLMKRDIHSVYMTGGLTPQQVQTAIQTTGHDLASAQLLEAAYTKQRLAGMHSHPAIRNWVKQQVNAGWCTQRLAADGFTAGEITQVMLDVEYEFLHSTWAECFTKGLIDQTILNGLFTAHGISASGAAQLISTLSYRLSEHQIVKNYMAGNVSGTTAQAMMASDGVPPTVASQLLSNADDGVANAQMMGCLAGVKHRYVMGEIDKQEATRVLAGFGMTNAAINVAVGNFDCSRSADGTHVPVAKLCEWLGLGAISPADFLDRLTRLGYSQVNAALLLADCARNYTARQLKEAQKQAKESAALIAKEERALQQADAAKKRQQKQLEKARSSRAKLREARDKQLLGASEKLYKQLGGSLQVAIDTVRAVIERLPDEFGISLDESLQIAILASEVKPIKTVDDYIIRVNAFAETASTSGLEPAESSAE